MIEKNQIRRFRDDELPDFRVLLYKEDQKKWFCTFIEDFGYYQYLFISEKALLENTELVE